MCLSRFTRSTWVQMGPIVLISFSISTTCTTASFTATCTITSRSARGWKSLRAVASRTAWVALPVEKREGEMFRAGTRIKRTSRPRLLILRVQAYSSGQTKCSQSLTSKIQHFQLKYKSCKKRSEKSFKSQTPFLTSPPAASMQTVQQICHRPITRAPWRL